MFKITDKDKQKVVIIQSGNGKHGTQNFSLADLTLGDGA